MSHMNSVRVPGTIIFTALLIIILVSASRTTYKLTPAKSDTTLVACDAAPAVVSRESQARDIDPGRACAWPRGARRNSARNASVDFVLPEHSEPEHSQPDASPARAESAAE